MSFSEGLDKIVEWQKKHGLIKILSFDVPASIRDNIIPYIDLVVAKTAQRPCKIALEDFGLTSSERIQIEHLRSCGHFGYLVDIEHMFIRLKGLRTKYHPLFSNVPEECPPSDSPSYDQFMTAMSAKSFPIYEMHLHNNDGAQDKHLFLEDGALDIEMIAKAIKALGFDEIMTIESAPGFQFECYGKEADEGILRTYRYWQNCLTHDS